MIVYLNGTLIERSKAHLSLDDRGFLFGEGLEFRAIGGVERAVIETPCE